MNILIIGNGFDLAHDLPTTYKDFLDFVNEFERYIAHYNNGNNSNYYPTETGEKFLRYFTKLIVEKKLVYEELSSFIKNNVWNQYFNKVYEERCKNGKTGWIDFENEISKVVQTVESLQKRIENNYSASDEMKLTPLEFNILKNFTSRIKILHQIGTKNDKKEELAKIKDKLLKDLNSLIRALEIYLSDFINNLPVEKRLPDIEGLKIDKVLSFNYTNTYERLYGKDSSDIEYDYIHGKADINHNVNSCDMVLGIDEYLTGEERDKNTEFIQFKKFYQRIYKKTGCEYIGWINGYLSRLKPKKSNKFNTIIEDFNIYIFGHSLDITDKDVLSKLILTKYARTKIFHFNRDALGKQIANLVKVIGQDNLISMVHGKHARIVLQQQQDAKNMEEEKQEE